MKMVKIINFVRGIKYFRGAKYVFQEKVDWGSSFLRGANIATDQH